MGSPDAYWHRKACTGKLVPAGVSVQRRSKDDAQANRVGSVARWRMSIGRNARRLSCGLLNVLSVALDGPGYLPQASELKLQKLLKDGLFCLQNKSRWVALMLL